MKIKTKFLTPLFENALAASGQNDTFPGGFEFFYPTAPNRSRLPDMKGEEDVGIDGEMDADMKLETDAESDMWAWGFGEYAREEIKDCDKSFRYLLRLMKTERPFAGVIGFSTGATTALILLSIAERGASAELMQKWDLDSGVSVLRFEEQISCRMG